ncbi:hypothetical protein Tco_0425809 [Tanacetum coccineum]
MHSNGMACFKGLESHLRSLYPNSYDHVRRPRLVELAFRRFFGEEHQPFRKKMLHNLDQLQLQFEKETLHAVNHFKDYMGSEPETYRSILLMHLDLLEKFIDKSVLKYGELRMQEGEVKAIKETEKRLNEATLHVHEIEQSLKLQSKDVPINIVKALDARLGVTESSGTESEKQDTSSRSRNDTDALDTDIKLVKETMAEVHLTSEHNILANRQQHAEQPEFNNEERVDQDAEQCQVKSPLLNPSPDNMTTEFSNPSLESENISLKKTNA